MAHQGAKLFGVYQFYASYSKSATVLTVLYLLTVIPIYLLNKALHFENHIQHKKVFQNGKPQGRLLAIYVTFAVYELIFYGNKVTYSCLCNTDVLIALKIIMIL